MRNLLAVVTIAALGACGDMSTMNVVPMSDASPAVDASHPDAAVEDLDMTLADFAKIQGFMTPTGRQYRVANSLGHEAEALAAASSPTGGNFPVGSIVEAQATEVMVKRRVGFDATTNDWEFFGITFAADGATPESFNQRGTEQTTCFMCHQMVSSITWDYMCDHP
jgi:hypothetical protein